MNMREKGVIAPLIVAMVVLGIWSAPLVSALNPVADGAIEHLQPRIELVNSAGASTLLDGTEGSNN